VQELILLIQVESSIRSIIFELLENENFNIISAEDGLIGLTLVKYFQPDLIICDINAPYLKRCGIIKRLRNDFDKFKIPCIFLTSEIEQDSSYCPQQLDADDYLNHPVQSEELLEAIYRQLKKTQKQQVDFVWKETNQTW